ncbi:MAG: cytochrome c biogenesis protein CcdA [Proteobacteria bacterium]|nr:cytochrome c biogenesis protein CcdA [Pseudomonadota bacterium]
MVATEITFGAAAGAGVISFLSPCVLPIVPAYLSFIAGTSLSELTGEEVAEIAVGRRVIMSALAFVVGFSAVFVTLGASASALSGLIVENVDIIGKVAGVVIVVFGLHYAGILKIPFLYREARFHPDRVPAGLFGAFLVGLAFGFGWTPCIGPILATILAVAASNDSLGYGVSLLGTYALGLGIPFLLAAIAIKPFMNFLKRFRRHMRKMEIATGGLLVITGVAIFTGDLSRFAFLLLEIFPGLAELG